MRTDALINVLVFGYIDLFVELHPISQIRPDQQNQYDAIKDTVIDRWTSIQIAVVCAALIHQRNRLAAWN